jgi:hypothetical protein
MHALSSGLLDRRLRTADRRRQCEVAVLGADARRVAVRLGDDRAACFGWQRTIHWIRLDLQARATVNRAPCCVLTTDSCRSSIEVPCTSLRFLLPRNAHTKMMTIKRIHRHAPAVQHCDSKAVHPPYQIHHQQQHQC